MLCSMWPPNFWRRMIWAKKMSEKLLWPLCLFPLNLWTSSLWSFMSKKEDMCIQLQNPSFNWLSCLRVCFIKRELNCWKADKDMKLGWLNCKKLLSKWQALRRKWKLKVLRLKLRKHRLINLQLKSKLRRKKCKLRTIRLKLKQINAVLSRKMSKRKRLWLNKNLKPLALWWSKPKKL